MSAGQPDAPPPAQGGKTSQPLTAVMHQDFLINYFGLWNDAVPGGHPRTMHLSVVALGFRVRLSPF